MEPLLFNLVTNDLESIHWEPNSYKVALQRGTPGSWWTSRWLWASGVPLW